MTIDRHTQYANCSISAELLSCYVLIWIVLQSALESRLASLFQDLTTLLKALRMVSPSRPTEFVNVTIETLHPATQHVDEIMSHVLHQLDDCCYELLLLSSLVPTTPWKVLQLK